MKERQRWQPEEDALLRAYVKQYGPKEWSLINQRMGRPLHRDPKSCLERWKNYLKPGIKKGSLTPDEQSLVISLQAKYGNKWKKIAAELPGRTAKRLGKWWEVFKEKQQKLLQKKTHRREFSDSDGNPNLPVPAAVESPEKALQGRYDHILDTFAEKYVQPKLFPFAGSTLNFPAALLPPPTAALADPEPVLSLGSVGSATAPVPPVLPLWMNANPPPPPTTSSSSASSSSPSPSVNLSLFPTDPADMAWLATLVQYCKEVEEERQNWMQHRKEAAWRLSRLEQQLESEKARKRREKTEAVEAEIRRLREEEIGFLGRIESEYREELTAQQRAAETTEAKLMEAWSVHHVKLAKLVDQIGNGGHITAHGRLTIGN